MHRRVLPPFTHAASWGWGGRRYVCMYTCMCLLLRVQQQPTLGELQLSLGNAFPPSSAMDCTIHWVSSGKDGACKGWQEVGGRRPHRTPWWVVDIRTSTKQLQDGAGLSPTGDISHIVFLTFLLLLTPPSIVTTVTVTLDRSTDKWKGAPE